MTAFRRVYVIVFKSPMIEIRCDSVMSRKQQKHQQIKMSFDLSRRSSMLIKQYFKEKHVVSCIG